MSLNVKDPEAYRLAQAISRKTGDSLTKVVIDSLVRQAISRKTGDSLTKVVIDSLRERHQKLQKRKTKASLAELMAIAKRAARSVKHPYLDHSDLLYDEHGLPKRSWTPRH